VTEKGRVETYMAEEAVSKYNLHILIRYPARRVNCWASDTTVGQIAQERMAITTKNGKKMISE
jgi:uncharacterized protein YbaA (DUF1428 family)